MADVLSPCNLIFSLVSDKWKESDHSLSITSKPMMTIPTNVIYMYELNLKSGILDNMLHETA
jgi:hypothetical protein